MKKYYKIIDGKTVVKNRNQIKIHKDKYQILNPKHDDLIADGWEEYIIAEPTTEQIINKAKRSKKSEIQSYHDSGEVKGFILNGKEHTVDTETLNKMTFRVLSESAVNIENTTLWFNDEVYHLSTQNAMNLLYNLQVYFGNCYDITSQHKSAIDGLSSEDEINTYDYKKDYPVKLDITF